MTVYMIEAGYLRDNYSGDYVEWHLEEDIGYFTDEEAARQKLGDLDRHAYGAYETHVRSLEQFNSVLDEQNAARARARNILKAQNLPVPSDLKEQRPRGIPSFDQWLLYNDSITRYRITKIEPAQ